MNIIQRPEVFNKFHTTEENRKKFRRQDPQEITKVIIHGTGGLANSKALIDGWILSDNFERAQAYQNGEGFPYNIDRNGDIYQFCDPAEYWQYHSGTWMPGKLRQWDMFTIGVELMNPSSSNSAEYTGDQYAALIELLAGDLMKRFTILEIWGHGAFQYAITGRYKNCPGPNFKWEILANDLLVNGFNYKTAKERIYEIVF